MHQGHTSKIIKPDFLTAIILLLTVTISCPLSLHAERKPYLKYGSTTEVPSLNLKLRLFKDMLAQPLSSIEVKYLTRTYKNGNQEKIECYFPEDLWRHSQTAGTWKNSICTVSLYHPTLPPPKEVKSVYNDGIHNYVRREEFDKWAAEQNIGTAWDNKKLAEWLTYLTGETIPEEPEIIKHGGASNAITKCFLNYQDGEGIKTELIYVLFSKYDPATPIVLRYQINSSGENECKKDIKTVSSSLASITFSKPAKKPAATKERKISTANNENRERSNEYIQSRNNIIESIKNLKEWWYLETDNFIMVANIKTQKSVKDLANYLERSRKLYTKFYPVETPLKSVSVARMFATRQGYVNYVGKNYEWTGGIWMSSRKELVVSPMNWGSRSDRIKMMMATTLHEAFHQYIYFATGMRTTSAWFNEGNAQFFEEARFKGGKVYIGINEAKAARMPALATESKIKDMLNMSYATFYSEKSRTDNYALAWGIIFFLQKGAPVMRDKNNYNEIPIKYYNEILSSGDADKATEKAWEGVNMEKFAEDFKNFWSNSNMIRKAVYYNPVIK